MHDWEKSNSKSNTQRENDTPRNNISEVNGLASERVLIEDNISGKRY